MAEFCDTCNKLKAPSPDLVSLAVYCKCDLTDKAGIVRQRSRMDGNKVNHCACGCGFIVKNGQTYLKAHLPKPKEETLVSRKEATETITRLEKIETKVVEDSYIENAGLIGEIEENDKKDESVIDYELVLDDLMQRYSELGIAIISIRRILRSQGKEPD